MALTPNEAYAAKQPFVDKETLEHIVEQFPTPFHLYDEAGIRRNMQEVRDAFAWNPGFKEYFAVKANPNPALISILNEYGCGCDCSSYTELMIARSLGITGHDIMFSSNDTPAADFELADKLGAIVNFDDISHIEFFERVAGPIPKTVSCRFNPGGLFQLSNGIMDNPGDSKYGMTTEQLRTKTKADALKHPNWNMGAKITIDSATLMNKGLELIEAAWLFGLPEDKIQIVVQRESIIHSAVQFADHSIIAQLGVPDMRIPIQYALTWPERLPSPVPELDFTALTKLSIATADDETFRCLKACKKAIRKGGLAPCAANGANEAAVAHFLRDEIGFLDIGRLVEGIVDSDSFGGDYTLADVHECDRMARAYVEAHI